MTDPERYRRVTARECALCGQVLKDVFPRFGLKPPNPTSDLGKMLAALEWLGSFPPDEHQPDAAWQADPQRATEAFVLYEQARRTAIAATWALTIPGSEKVIVRLKKRLNRLQSQDEEALDYFFELDIAHRLAQRRVPISFGEPDLVIGDGNRRFGLACKRPRNVSGMRDKIREGAGQVARQDFPGMIVIGLEAMLHISGDPQKPTIIYLVDTPQELGSFVNPRIDEWLTQAEGDIEYAFRKGVWGILFCGLATGLARQIKPGFGGPIHEWFRRPRSNPLQPESAEILDQYLFGSPPPADAIE